MAPRNDAPHRLINDVEFGDDVTVYSFTNLYGCRIGSGSRIGTFVEVQRGARIGERCKIQSHTFICDGVSIGDRVFVGHGVMFINDRRPRATSGGGGLQTEDDWELAPTVVEDEASIGSGATILGGVRIGAGALVGAGAVVTKDVAPGATVVGNPPDNWTERRVQDRERPARAVPLVGCLGRSRDHHRLDERGPLAPALPEHRLRSMGDLRADVWWSTTTRATGRRSWCDASFRTPGSCPRATTASRMRTTGG